MTPKLLALAAAALIAVGLVLGLSPISALGVNCGSALAPDDSEANVADLYDTLGGNTPRAGLLGGVAVECDDRISSRRPFVASLLVAGGIAAFGAIVTRQRPRSTGHEPSGTGSDASRNMDTPR